MLRLHAIQAEKGDCLLLEWGTNGKPAYLLIDGGPDGVYRDHLSGFLRRTVRTSRLERVMLSHVDDDHANGLLDFFQDLAAGGSDLQVGGLWHNTFTQILGQEIEDRFFTLVDQNFRPAGLRFLQIKDRDVEQGDVLTHRAAYLKIPINPETGAQTVFTVEGVPQPFQLEGISLRVVGPLEKNIKRLQRDWKRKLKTQEELLAAGILPKDTDTSVPNMSSIMLLVEAQGKTILLTGDGRSDDLIDGLRMASMLPDDRPFHVDVLKLPHHGSARNASLDFFRQVTADRYVISADGSGKDKNPDLETLEWIAQAARESGRKVEILITNQTGNGDLFKEQFIAGGNTWIELPKEAHAITLDFFPAAGAPAVTFDAAGSAAATALELPPGPAHIEVIRPEPASIPPSSRRALLVGINQFHDPDLNPLRGCINDTEDMKDVLRRFYGFEDGEIHILKDREAAGDGIRSELDWLLSGSAAGDVRIFHFSSHGSQVDDQSDDELECLDEVILPYDHDWEHPFRDDELASIFEKIPAGVNFTFLADCCHSGSINRAPREIKGLRVRAVSPPAPIQERIQANFRKRDQALEGLWKQEKARLRQKYGGGYFADHVEELYEAWRQSFRRKRYGTAQAGRHVFLAACEDEQTSADAWFDETFRGGAYRGAFTWAVGQVVREYNGGLTYDELISGVAWKLGDFAQAPQLGGPPELRGLRLFSGIR
jgi:beta-lactamase superfamily II metal-dependent hydrolase